MEPAQYERPQRWIRYDRMAVTGPLAEARALVQALDALPGTRVSLDRLRERQLAAEAAATARIDAGESLDRDQGAPFARVDLVQDRERLRARSVLSTCQWLGGLAADLAPSGDLIREIHRHLVTGCDDDRSPAGRLRERGKNVVFGMPPMRGCDGGAPCEESFAALGAALSAEFCHHDLLVQAFAVHYHLATMHPFAQANGRTARATEALLLQRAGLRGALFAAMSVFYDTERLAYVQALAAVRAADANLTPFLLFALKGLSRQCQTLFAERRVDMQKALFRDTMHDLFGRLQSRKLDTMKERLQKILLLILDAGRLERAGFSRLLFERGVYRGMKAAAKAADRDWRVLQSLGAVDVVRGPSTDDWRVSARLDWPAEINEAEFVRRLKELPGHPDEPRL